MSQWIIAMFSPTGNTARIARAIAKGTGADIRDIDLSAPVAAETVPADAVLLAVVPVFGGYVPAICLEHLAQLKGQGGTAVAVVVYGNRAYDNALAQLKVALEQNGFRVPAAAAFVAEHSIIRTIAAGRPDENDLKAAEDFGAAAAAKLAKAEAEQTAIQVPGDPTPPEGKGGIPASVQASDKCVKCGACAAVCPVGAIPAEDPSKTDGSKCIKCMRCVSVCPQQARNLPAPALMMIGGMLKMKASAPRQPELFL